MDPLVDDLSDFLGDTDPTMDPIVDDFLGDTDPTMDPIVDEMPIPTGREKHQARFEERDSLKDAERNAEKAERKQRQAAKKQLRAVEDQQQDMRIASRRAARQAEMKANQAFRTKLNEERKMQGMNTKITGAKLMLSTFPTAKAAADAYIAQNPRAEAHRDLLEGGYNKTKQWMETAEDIFLAKFGTPHVPYLRSGYGVWRGQKIGDASLGRFPTPLMDQLKANPPKGNRNGRPSNMATGGAVRGYASGGDVALIKLAKMNGMQGDDIDTARAFMNASEGLRKKVQAMGALINKGGLAMAQGGSVPNQAMIGGQPHRLAYVNPQEEAMMKAAGGAGVPSYGGIPAYFSLGPGMTVGETATDPMTGTVYTWDGSGWTADTGYDVGTGMGTASTEADPFTVQQAERTQNLITQTMQPTQAAVSYIQPQAADFVPVDAGQATPIAPYAEAATVGTVQQANQQATPVAQTYDFTPAYSQVQAETAGLQPAQGAVSDQAQVAAQQQTTSAVTGMQGAQGVSTDIVAPAPRDLQTGELIDPVANAASAAAYTEQVQAATATPSAKATVAGQLEGLMQQFEGGNTPAWAAGSMRTAMATLAARGLGASSLAGQAVIQATMEAALPIAQMDAQVQAQFEGQNLTNRQQRAMLSAQQRATFLGMEFDQAFQARVQNSARIGDIANMNFSAEQNIALENARAANTMNLNNLSNRQAMIMAEAAALSNLDMANLNNRQQAAVQNAQSFLNMDMANLSNAQQTAIFKSQQNVQALFTDQAAENAALQFNATSQNQTDQYFANLRSQTSQFNASQQNAMDQFNVNSVNALREFNSEIQQQRDLFNAQNGLLIAQSNAQWRQTLSTANAAAQNESNMNFAKTINALTATNLDAYWQRERDVMSFAYASGESAADRVATILQTQLEAELKAEYQDAQGKGGLFATLIKGGLNYLGLAGGGKNLILPGAS